MLYSDKKILTGTDKMELVKYARKKGLSRPVFQSNKQPYYKLSGLEGTHINTKDVKIMTTMEILKIFGVDKFE